MKEPADNVENKRKRAEDDKDSYVRIFRAVTIRTTKSDIRFCRRRTEGYRSETNGNRTLRGGIEETDSREKKRATGSKYS